MKKLKKNDLINIGIIITLFIIYILIIYKLGYIYGSEVDWISQHFRIPEYLRNLFYDTFNLFPNFAFNLGAGQNIYYLSYHGLFNPIVILSYLFPFIKMVDYIILINIILIILSVFMIYKWINDKFNSRIAFISSFLFILSGPIIFHSHRHIMFTDYMLFLILALIMVDKYFKNGDKKWLIFNVLMIILTSYFYSVGAIIVICIYALYKYLTLNKIIYPKAIFKEGIKFVLIIGIPILISSILLLPTIYTLITGRSDTNVNINILQLIVPVFNINSTLYQSYSIGLSSILIISLIENILSGNRNLKILSIIISIILIFPIFNFLLNGTMYIDGKSLIPFLPLCIYLIANTLNNIINNKINLNKLIIISLITFFIILLTNLNFKYITFFIIDYMTILGSFLLYRRKNNHLLIFIPMIIINFILCIIINNTDNFVEKEKYNQINNNVTIKYDNNLYRTGNLFNILENVNNIQSNNYYSTTIYSSTSNMYYTKFIRDIFQNEIYNKDYHTLTQSNNILFNTYMGTKYLLSPYNVYGYEKKDNNIYINNNVFSIGYATNKIMSKEEFDSLSYPYTIDALLNYIVVDQKLDNVYKSNILKYDKDINLISYSDLTLNKDNDMYIIDSQKNGKMNIKLNEEIKNKIIIISFNMNYNDRIDTTIKINDTINTLSYKGWKYHNKNYTFNYVVYDNNLNIEFSKGHYEINDLNIYTIDYDTIKNITTTHDDYIIDSQKTNGDNIYGNINVSEDGYFIINIPYEKGFNFYIDNKKIDYELVNEAFMGFKIDKGMHEIKINYIAPFSKISKLFSIIGVIIYLVIIIFDRRKKNEKN